jgi:hypothetical protein
MNLDIRTLNDDEILAVSGGESIPGAGLGKGDSTGTGRGDGLGYLRSAESGLVDGLKTIANNIVHIL